LIKFRTKNFRKNMSTTDNLVKKKKKRGIWTEEEDNALIKAVKENGPKNWKNIATFVPGKTYVQCLHRWQKVLNPNLVKGPWTEEEDRKVIELVNLYGIKKWKVIATYLPGRIGKQCRERWMNHLDPNIKKGNWQPNEDEVILEQQSKIGNKWAAIAKLLPGRTDNAIKNRFNSTLSRRLKKQNDNNDKSKKRKSPGKKINTTTKNNNKTNPLENKIEQPNESSTNKIVNNNLNNMPQVILNIKNEKVEIQPIESNQNKFSQKINEEQPTCYVTINEYFEPENIEQRTNLKRKFIDTEINSPNKKFKSSKNGEISFNNNDYFNYTNFYNNDPSVTMNETYGIFLTETYNPILCSENTYTIDNAYPLINNDFIYQDMVYDDGLFYNDGIDYDFSWLETDL